MLQKLLHELSCTAWAVEEWALNAMQSSVIAGRAAAPEILPIETKRGGNVAIVQIRGVIMHKDSMLARWFGLATCEGISETINNLVNDETINHIVLDIDSPGGSVFGVGELAEEIFSLRESKKITAISNPLMASAAYWIGSAASEVVAIPSSETGSIGVFGMHIEQSKMLDELGIDVTLISAGKYKTEGNAFEPLTDEAREHMQATINQYYSQFTSAVAKFRGVKSSDVTGGFGQGRVLTAKDAKAAGLVDRIQTQRQFMNKLTATKARTPRRRLQAELNQLSAT